MNALAILGAAIVLTLPSGGSSIGPATIEVTSQQLSLSIVNLGGRGATPTMEISRSRLFDRQGRLIGRRELVCTVVYRTSRSCQGTYFFPRGTIVVGGSIVNRHSYTLAVLGGTRLYDNARGSLSVTPIFASRDRVFIRLVG